ncbi:C1 family peptidase [Mesorhizobium sp. M0965]|uniref:C1 family peptidase n=1 Tax=unclassified Mesorhizobium TaxID=325217 RepID=UPI0033356FA8
MTLHILTDLRSVLGPVRDQGRRPTCLSFAASAVHEQARGDLDSLCVEWLFYHAAQRAGTGPAEGTTLPDTRQVLHDIGQPLEPVWPYKGLPVQATAWRPPPSVSPLFRCGSDCCDTNVQQIRERLDGGSPVVLALFVSSAFTAATTWLRTGNEIILPKDGEPIDRQRGHAVVAVGHGRFDSEDLILVRNSWGPAWGAAGHAWVRETYMSRRLCGGFSISEGDGDVLQSDAAGIDARARVG